MSSLEEQLAAKDAEIETLRAEICLAKSMHKVAIDRLTQTEALITDLPDAVHMVNGLMVVRPEKLNKILAAIASVSEKR
jgi:septal ring factor EnvC (AmiA/AmiB activator)